MSERQKKERSARLVDQADRGNGLAPFLEHPDVEQFVKEYEAKQIKAIAAAAPSDDETRRDAGLKIQAIRALMDEMRGIVATGRRAAETLEGLDHG